MTNYGMTWLAAIPQYREIRAGELRWIVSQETTLDAATGERHTRATIRHPGVAVILPILDDGRILVMRQYRYALDGELWELPAGTRPGREAGRLVDSPESAEACAARELQEETGWRATRLEPLGEAFAMPGMSDELIHCFVARGLLPTRHERDEGELIREIRPMSEDELRQMVVTNQIRDAKTLVALMFYWMTPR
ncbi:MAG: NUDIX hydrolase [Candidatus Eisenbacteria bacterium]|nr:NUDIX hydrolase [Candidatus Eisenbacteria bacterium]